MTDGLIILGALVALAFVAGATKKRSVDGMRDNPVQLDNIRRGVANGWYKATLVRVGDKPAIHLFGKDAAGNDYGDIFPISEHDWQTLKAEGYRVQE